MATCLSKGQSSHFTHEIRFHCPSSSTSVSSSPHPLLKIIIKIGKPTRMHSSRMHTSHGSSRPRRGGASASVHAGIHNPPHVWAWRHPLSLPACGPGEPSGCGPGDNPWLDPSASPLGVGLDTTHARHAGILPSPWIPARHAGIPTPRSGGQNDRQVQKYYLAPNFVCGW